jgi:indole-3-glycerol phosphate synthase
MILERIVEAKREEVSTAKSRCPLSDLKMRIDAPPARDFIGAVRRDDLIQQNEGVSPDKPDKAVGPAARISSAWGEMRRDAAERDETVKRKQERGARRSEKGHPVSFTGQSPGKKQGDDGSESLGTDSRVDAGTYMGTGVGACMGTCAGTCAGTYMGTGVVKGITLIAEIKKASPSRGLICRDFNPRQIACFYQEAGASAISVLTDERFFQGHPDFLKVVKEVTSLPLLRKDFIIDEYQIYQSRLLGADAVLLIAAILGRQQLVEYICHVKELGMAALVEVHTHDELCRVLETEALLVGINNRNLHTFQVDLGVTYQLISAVPKERVVVSESGICSREDVIGLAEAGVDAVLVGEALMGAGDIRAAVAELLGVPR